MGAVFAQFTTPFEIKDLTDQAYSSIAYLRMPRDPHYLPPNPDRMPRGWIVVCHKNGDELFRADVNLFMDGGVGVLLDDASAFSDALLKSAARLMDTQQSVEVMSAILQRMESMHSPWAKINFGSFSSAVSTTGFSCFHQDTNGKRTPGRFVVDLRLERFKW